MVRAKLLAPIGLVSCFLFAGHTGAFAQWPGQSETVKKDPRGWPNTQEDRAPVSDPPRTDSRSSTNNLLCAFDYRHAAGAVANFRIGRSGKPVCPAGGTDYGSYFSGDRKKALEDLIKQAGVRRDRIVAVEKPGFRNAAAVLCEARDGEIKRLVIWDPEFLGGLDRKAGTRWASVAVLAHEIAHHLNLDTGQNPRSIPPHERRQQELFADQYAGANLRRLGASRRHAVAVFYHMGAGGESHPPSQRRVAAAGRGWDGSSSAGTASGGNRLPRYDTPSRRDDYSPPRPRPPRVATLCMTQAGFCGMLVRGPVGAPCFCRTPFANFPGMAR